VQISHRRDAEDFGVLDRNLLQCLQAIGGKSGRDHRIRFTPSRASSRPCGRGGLEPFAEAEARLEGQHSLLSSSLMCSRSNRMSDALVVIGIALSTKDCGMPWNEARITRLEIEPGELDAGRGRQSLDIDGSSNRGRDPHRRLRPHAVRARKTSSPTVPVVAAQYCDRAEHQDALATLRRQGIEARGDRGLSVAHRHPHEMGADRLQRRGEHLGSERVMV